MRKRIKHSKHSSETNMSVPDRLLENAGKKNDVICRVYDCHFHELTKLLADIATGLWRINNKFSAVDIDILPNELKKAHRHIESTMDALIGAKADIRDHANEKYVAGMALKVIAYQPSSSVQVEMITETIKPSVFYKDELIQMGEVIVATPATPELEEDSKAEDISKNKERNSE